MICSLSSRSSPCHRSSSTYSSQPRGSSILFKCVGQILTPPSPRMSFLFRSVSPSHQHLNMLKYLLSNKKKSSSATGCFPATPLSFFFFFSFFKKLINFYFWLRWVFVAARGLPLVVASVAWASHRGGFSCCGTRTLGTWASVAVARGL